LRPASRIVDRLRHRYVRAYPVLVLVGAFVGMVWWLVVSVVAAVRSPIYGTTGWTVATLVTNAVGLGFAALWVVRSFRPDARTRATPWLFASSVPVFVGIVTVPGFVPTIQVSTVYDAVAIWYQVDFLVGTMMALLLVLVRSGTSRLPGPTVSRWAERTAPDGGAEAEVKVRLRGTPSRYPWRWRAVPADVESGSWRGWREAIPMCAARVGPLRPAATGDRLRGGYVLTCLDPYGCVFQVGVPTLDAGVRLRERLESLQPPVRRPRAIGVRLDQLVVLCAFALAFLAGATAISVLNSYPSRAVVLVEANSSGECCLAFSAADGYGECGSRQAGDVFDTRVLGWPSHVHEYEPGDNGLMIAGAFTLPGFAAAGLALRRARRRMATLAADLAGTDPSDA
jgi:hypothetical protein